jgi:hypothetical protein
VQSLVTVLNTNYYRRRGVDPKEHEVLASYKALLEISVVVPPAFARNSDSVAGVCDSAPKPARSQGNLVLYIILLLLLIL